MERRKMAAIFLGAGMLLWGFYALANWGGSEPKTGETKNKNLFSAEGPATIGNNDGTDNGWGDLLSQPNIQETPEDRTNATKNIAKVAFEQMKSLDQQGKSPFDRANTDTPEVRATVESSVNGSLGSFFEGAAIDDREMKIFANNTKTAKIAYLKNVEAALARHSAKESYKNYQGGLQEQIETSCTGGDPGINKDVAGGYTTIAKEFIAIGVPSSWIGFHRQAIEHYRQGAIIFNAISGCVNDPLKGLVAVQSLPAFGINAAALQNLLKKMYTEVGL